METAPGDRCVGGHGSLGARAARCDPRSLIQTRAHSRRIVAEPWARRPHEANPCPEYKQCLTHDAEIWSCWGAGVIRASPRQLRTDATRDAACACRRPSGGAAAAGSVHAETPWFEGVFEAPGPRSAALCRRHMPSRYKHGRDATRRDSVAMARDLPRVRLSLGWAGRQACANPRCFARWCPPGSSGRRRRRARAPPRRGSKCHTGGRADLPDCGSSGSP